MLWKYRQSSSGLSKEDPAGFAPAPLFSCVTRHDTLERCAPPCTAYPRVQCSRSYSIRAAHSATAVLELEPLAGLGGENNITFTAVHAMMV